MSRRIAPTPVSDFVPTPFSNFHALPQTPTPQMRFGDAPQKPSSSTSSASGQRDEVHRVPSYSAHSLPPAANAFVGLKASTAAKPPTPGSDVVDHDVPSWWSSV